MRDIIKNDFFRAWEKKERLLVQFVLIFLAVTVALFMNNSDEPTTRLAVVGMNHELKFSDQPGIKVTYLEQKPVRSEIVMGKYDAVIYQDGDHYQIETVKNKKYKQELEALLSQNSFSSSYAQQQIKPGVRIISYLMMFLLMSSVTNMFVFSEDKDKHVFERVATTPVSISKILFGHSVFSFFFLFLPVIGTIYIEKILLNVAIGFSFFQYVMLLGLLCFFATAFSLCNASLFKDPDNSNMLGSSVVIMTTLLSGSFFSLEDGNQSLRMVTEWLPQKQYINLLELVAKGESYKNQVVPFLFLVGISVLLSILAVCKTRKDYMKA